MLKKVRIIFCLVMYILLCYLVFPKDENFDKINLIPTMVLFGVIFFLPVISQDLIFSIRRIHTRATGNVYTAVIVDILEEATTDTEKVKYIYMFIRVRFYDSNNEIRDEWVNTEDIYLYNRKRFVRGQTVRICDNDTDTCILSRKAKKLTLPDVPEDTVIPVGNMLIDMSVEGIRKRAVPEVREKTRVEIR